MILLLLLSLPLLASSSDSFLRVPLYDKWECGPENSKWSTIPNWLSKVLVNSCHEAVQDDANLCCKAHDHCYDVHSETHVNQHYCDKRFCYCLQDVIDRAKNEGRNCKIELASYCVAVTHLGDSAFYASKPSNHWYLSRDFQDAKPWGLDTKTLVKACQHSRKIAIHCHNSAVNCLGKPHERDRRDYVKHSREDCRSTMYDCLQTLIESTLIEKESETCISAARNLADQMFVYDKLDEERHGKAIIDIYPIVASRLLKHCDAAKDSLEKCYTNFDDCSQNNHEENPEYYNAARKIKLPCHKDLKGCIDTSINEFYSHIDNDVKENCTEASYLANSLIRENEFDEEKGVVQQVWDTAGEKTGEGVEFVVDMAKTGYKKTVGVLETAGNYVGDAAKTTWSGMKSAAGSVKDFFG